jgi:hypothetical protein
VISASSHKSFTTHFSLVICSQILTDFSVLCIFYSEGHNTWLGIWNGNTFGLSNKIQLFHVFESLLIVGFLQFSVTVRARMLFHFIESFLYLCSWIEFKSFIVMMWQVLHRRWTYVHLLLYPSSSALPWRLIRAEWAVHWLQKTFQLH